MTTTLIGNEGILTHMKDVTGGALAKNKLDVNTGKTKYMAQKKKKTDVNHREQ